MSSIQRMQTNRYTYTVLFSCLFDYVFDELAICIHSYTCVYVCTFTYVYMYICIYIYTHVFIYIYIERERYMHIKRVYIYMYTHTCWLCTLASVAHLQLARLAAPAHSFVSIPPLRPVATRDVAPPFVLPSTDCGALRRSHDASYTGAPSVWSCLARTAFQNTLQPRGGWIPLIWLLLLSALLPYHLIWVCLLTDLHI